MRPRPSWRLALTLGAHCLVLCIALIVATARWLRTPAAITQFLHSCMRFCFLQDRPLRPQVPPRLPVLQHAEDAAGAAGALSETRLNALPSTCSSLGSPRSAAHPSSNTAPGSCPMHRHAPGRTPRHSLLTPFPASLPPPFRSGGKAPSAPRRSATRAACATARRWRSWRPAPRSERPARARPRRRPGPAASLPSRRGRAGGRQFGAVFVTSFLRVCLRGSAQALEKLYADSEFKSGSFAFNFCHLLPGGLRFRKPSGNLNRRLDGTGGSAGVPGKEML